MPPNIPRYAGLGQLAPETEALMNLWRSTASAISTATGIPYGAAGLMISPMAVAQTTEVQARAAKAAEQKRLLYAVAPWLLVGGLVWFLSRRR